MFEANYVRLQSRVITVIRICLHKDQKRANAVRPCGASHINRRPGFEARPAATSRKQSAHGYFLLRSEASNKTKPTVTSWNKGIRAVHVSKWLSAIFYYAAGANCVRGEHSSPAGPGNNMCLYKGQIRRFPHQPQAHFQNKSGQKHADHRDTHC